MISFLYIYTHFFISDPCRPRLLCLCTLAIWNRIQCYIHDSYVLPTEYLMYVIDWDIDKSNLFKALTKFYLSKWKLQKRQHVLFVYFILKAKTLYRPFFTHCLRKGWFDVFTDDFHCLPNLCVEETLLNHVLYVPCYWNCLNFRPVLILITISCQFFLRFYCQKCVQCTM